MKCMRQQNAVLLRKSRYCDNSQHEPEIMPVSPLPRVSEHTCMISCSRQTAYHAVFCFVKCKRALCIAGQLHLICIFNCTYNNRHNFSSLQCCLMSAPTVQVMEGTKGRTTISESSYRVIKLVSNYALRIFLSSQIQ